MDRPFGEVFMMYGSYEEERVKERGRARRERVKDRDETVRGLRHTFPTHSGC